MHAVHYRELYGTPLLYEILLKYSGNNVSKQVSEIDYILEKKSIGLVKYLARHIPNLVGQCLMSNCHFQICPDIICAKCFRHGLSLKGSLRHLSKGCTTGVRPSGITATSMFCFFRSPFTELVKRARNESHTRRECSARHKLCLIHSLTPCSSIQPFLWKETWRRCGTTRALGVWMPLKVTFGDTFVPSTATPRTMVKLRFSNPQDFTVRLPLNFG